MQLKTYRVAEMTFRPGQTVKLTNGNVLTIKSIWSDKYGDSIGYVCADGRPGDTPPNSLYWSIKGV